MTVFPRRRTRAVAPEGVGDRARMRAAQAIDRRWGWDKVAWPVSIWTLLGLRMKLRRDNLFDPLGEVVPWGPESPSPQRALTRSLDGSGNDPDLPAMGSAGSVFGRNVPPEDVRVHDVLDPSPRIISNELLARGQFIPAPALNLLMAAWIQFEVHDWMSHGQNERDRPYHCVPLDPDDQFPGETFDGHMRILRTRHEPGDAEAVFRNEQSHWWDASQLYGSTPETARRLRTGRRGHLVLRDGLVPIDPPNDYEDLPDELKPLRGSWWLGLAMFHTLFIREHNAICDRLAMSHPDWSDERLYQTARLVNAALIAKIHSLEWTPALLANHRTDIGARINWWGFQGETLHRWFGNLTNDEEWSGIPGSDLYYHSVPYALTEEFLSVYRMHPLIPDDFTLRSPDTEGVTYKFEEVSGPQTRKVLDTVAMADLFYSFATAHPGAVVLNNYPDALRQLQHPDGARNLRDPHERGPIDLATIDILRDRERGVPRYNEFRRALRLPPATRFEDFSADPAVVRKLAEIYRNPEQVDLMIGLYTETPPAGFAISDTAFRVFLLMASRRLKSDRFFTTDYRAEVYTKEGIRWIAENTLGSVLSRHFPELADRLGDVENAFRPWDSPDNRRPASCRQRIRNALTRSKFQFVEPLPIPPPSDDEEVGAIPFSQRYPTIPIAGLEVADRYPKDEYDGLVFRIIRAEERFGALTAALRPPRRAPRPIDADPRRALDAAYPASYRRLYRTPSRPHEYDPVDLGRLAVASPYAYLLDVDPNGRVQWDLTRLGEFELHGALRSPAVLVEFEVDADRRALKATRISSELGTSAPGDHDWDRAQRLAMCAAATHATLVRHFNWIHLVCGERFALATHQCLPVGHPVRELVQPHIYLTHFGNRIVTPMQLQPGGDFESIFSYTHAGVCSLFEATAPEFDLRFMEPDREMEVRGLDGLAGAIDLPAVDNRRRLMDVIRRHARSFLDVDFDRDAAIADDEPLARWIDALARMRGVRELTGPKPTLDSAADLIASLIYMVSVDHEIVDSGVWDYQLWSDVQTPRVYRDGRRLPVDVYQRLVNANFILNVDRTLLMTDFSNVTHDARRAAAFRTFREELVDLQYEMDKEEAFPWRIEPRNLKANINY